MFFFRIYENIAASRSTLTSSQRFLNCLNAPINAEQIFGREQLTSIVNCNNNENIDDCSDVYNSLEYYGNPLLNLQLYHLELIRNNILTWDYCYSGGADIEALLKFAFYDQKFELLSIIAGHDPQIHPGKGIIGLRLNGVNNAQLNNVSISNLHSYRQKSFFTILSNLSVV